MKTLDRLDQLGRARGKGEPRGNDATFQPDYPQFDQIGRYGSTRYTPSLRQDEKGRVFVYWYDNITIAEYDEMRMDGQIRAGLNLKKLPIQRAKWNVSCTDDDIAAFVTEVMRPIWPSLIRQSLLALEFGFSCFEKIWTVAYGLHVTNGQGNMDAGKERVYPHALKLQRLLQLDPKLMWLLGYRWSSEFAGVRQFSPSDAVIPAEKSFLFTLNKEFGELYGVADVKPCYPYWLLGKLAYENASMFYETYTLPMRKVTFPMGQTPMGKNPDGSTAYVSNADLALEYGDSLRNSTTLAIPSTPYAQEGGTPIPQWDVSFLESERSGADHIQWINHLELMKLKSLLVPQLALETGNVGAQALAETQVNFFMRGEEALADQLIEAINDQIVAQIVKYNFGANAPKAYIRLMPITDTFEQGLRDLFLETIGQGKPIPMKDGGAMVPDWGWMADFLDLPVQYLDDTELDVYMQGSEKINPTPQVVGPDGQPVQPGQGGAPGQPGQTGAKPGQAPPSAPPTATDGQDGQDYQDVNFAERDSRWQIVDGELVWAAA